MTTQQRKPSQDPVRCINRRFWLLSYKGVDDSYQKMRYNNASRKTQGFPVSMAFASAQSRLHTLVSAVVVLGFIFQLGACPCGCLEHNYWAQALGLSPHESHIVDNHGTELAIHGDHDHDCTGVAATVFVNNARTIESPDLGPSVWVCCAAGTAELQLACHRGEVSRRSPHDLWGHGRTPSELQVFLL